MLNLSSDNPGSISQDVTTIFNQLIKIARSQSIEDDAVS